MLIGITAPLYAVHFLAPGWGVIDAVALLLCVTGGAPAGEPLCSSLNVSGLGATN